MTTQEIIDYYADLLIIQYIGQPKAYATIQALAKMVVSDQLATQVMNAFNIIGDDIAIGTQLDVIGKYTGVVRSGFGFNGPITLDDTDFLSLINMSITRNHAKSDLGDIVALMFKYFPNEVFTYDYQNMRMSYLINSSIGPQELIEMFVVQGLLPKPLGVQLASPIYSSDIGKFFGFVRYNRPPYGAPPYYILPVNAQPFNSYNAIISKKWLSYANAVTV